MNKKFRSAVCILLALLMLFSVLFSVIGGISALAVSQSEIDALEADRKVIRDRQSDVAEQLNALKADMAFVLDKKAALDEQSELKRQDIEIISAQIELYDAMIREMSLEVAAAEEQVQQQYERYCQRLRAMEEHGGGMWYLTYLFQSESFTALLGRLDDVMEIISRDQDLSAEYVAAKEAAEALQAEYEQTQLQQQEKKAELLKEKELLEQEINEACEMIRVLEDDIDVYAAFYEENEKLEAEIQAKIDKKVAQMKAEEEARRKAEEARKKAEEEARRKAAAANGSYYWPCQSSVHITSKFGYRIHPIFGTTKFHSGVDVAAYSGSTLSAAADGTVTIAEYSSSYGNYVVIYHSNGTTTLYAHLSKMAVSAGDTVKLGQTIGYVGSTGNSTGPHLHFEVRVNGSCVDPLKYFKLNFSYASDA